MCCLGDEEKLLEDDSRALWTQTPATPSSFLCAVVMEVVVGLEDECKLANLGKETRMARIKAV